MSIAAQKGGTAVEVIVVDNTSTDGSADMVRVEFPTVKLLAMTENLGFTRGNNAGFAVATGQILFMLNPDTTLVGNALDTLVSVLMAHKDVGAVGPLLRFPNGAIQSTGNRLPTTDVLFTVNLPAPRAVFRVVGRWHLPVSAETREVGWVVGAALMVKREVYTQIGGMDNQFFMYFEETDWQKRMHNAGWRIQCVPHAEIIHHADAAGKQVSAWSLAQFNRSRVLYTRKWKGVIVAELLILWAVLLYSYRIAEESVKQPFGKESAGRAEKTAAYRASIKEMFSASLLNPFRRR